MKIAVIGSGIAGLTTAWLLAREVGSDGKTPKNAVTLFERSARLGMDASGVDVDLNQIRRQQQQQRQQQQMSGGGTTATVVDALPASKPDKVRIDVPLRVFTESYYPNLSSLYSENSIPVSPEDYASSFTTLSGKNIFGYKNYLIGKRSIPFPSPAAPAAAGTGTGTEGTESGAAAAASTSSSWWQWLRGITNRSYWSLVYETFYFLYKAPSHLASGELLQLTFEQYVTQYRFSPEWIHQFALPALAGICTCSFHAVKNYPAQIIVHYVLTRSGFGVRRVSGGTELVVSRLCQGSTVKCNAHVAYVESIDGGKRVRLVMGSSGGAAESKTKTNTTAATAAEYEDFDHVILATQANQALKLLKDPSATLIKALSGFEYERSTLVLHTDSELMPRDRTQWRSVNFILEHDTAAATAAAAGSSRSSGPVGAEAEAAKPTPEKKKKQNQAKAVAGAAEEKSWTSPSGSPPASPSIHHPLSESVAVVTTNTVRGESMASIWMNRVHHDLYHVKDVDIFQTWNPIAPPKPHTVLCSGEFERPVVSFGSVSAIGQLWREQGHNNLWFVGSYALYGMPLLETAVSSAIQVAQRLGAECPWMTGAGAGAGAGAGSSGSGGGDKCGSQPRMPCAADFAKNGNANGNAFDHDHSSLASSSNGASASSSPLKHLVMPKRSGSPLTRWWPLVVFIVLIAILYRKW